MMAMLSACDNTRKLPGGVMKYGVDIKKVFEEVEHGTFSFANFKDQPLGNRGRGGYIDFPPLELKFTLKNGKQYHEVIELEPLMQQMEQQHNLPDVSQTEFGGFAYLKIKVGKQLIIDYELSIKTDNSGVRYKDYSFPVYHKVLN